MKCEGAGKPPKQQYKAIRHYNLRNGRPHYTTGQGECAHCGACHAVRPKKDGTAYVVTHKDIRQCTAPIQRQNRRRKLHWTTYAGMNRFSFEHAPIIQGTLTTGASSWGGPVNQVINVVETPTYVNSYTTGLSQTWTGQLGNFFRVEMQSNTQNAAGQYVFQLNDQTILGPTQRMTVAVDYASWNAWNNTITVSNQARIQWDQTWRNWTVPLQANINYNDAYRQRHGAVYTAPRRTPEEIAEEQQRRAEALFQRVEAERRAKEEAQTRAFQTLMSLLTPEQREEYRVRKHFHMRGSKGTLYRILHGSSGNVRQVLSEADEGRGLHAFCAHPRMSVDARTAEAAGISAGHLPHEDAMIAQMLALMTDEDAFLAVANRHW